MKRDIAKKYALIDLHLHFDGSMTAHDIIKMAELSKISLPTNDIKELDNMLKCPKNCLDLNDYLKCFDLPLSVLQTKDTLVYGIQSLIRWLDHEGLLYAEIRFAPQLHMQNGLSQEQVVESVIFGMKEILQNTKIKTRLILCCMRGENNNLENIETVRVAAKFLNQGVVSCDLAGAEGLYPTYKYKELFSYAKSLEVPFTIHAGEADGYDSVKNAVSFGAKRIGHGILMHNHNKGIKCLQEHHITLELCPTSNLNTNALEGVKKIDQYPLKDFLKQGVLVSINTDNMTVSDTTLENEFFQLLQAGIINENDCQKILKDTIRATFLGEEEQKELWNKCNEIIQGK